MRVKLDQAVQARDGVRLSADVYLPAGDGPFPVLAARTIQDNQAPEAIEWVPRFIEAGYAVVTQDCRGRFDSDGDWDPYVNETTDGHDTIEWISLQQWCDGNVGMFGSGYMGYAQTRAALGDIKVLKAIAPSSSQQDNFGYWFTHGPFQWHTALNFLETAGSASQTGAPSLVNREELWSRLPLATALDDVAEVPFFKKALEHNRYDEFWKDDSLLDRYGHIQVPALFVTGWYDVLLHETVRMFQGFAANAGSEEARSKSKLIIGPWHSGNLGSGLRSGDVDFGPDSGLDLAAEHLRWYDRRLRGIDTGIDDEPPVRIFYYGREHLAV